MTIKGVYALFDNTQNWIRVKTLKLANHLIKTEPRLAKKLEPKIFTLLASANSKPVECELVRLCIAHYLYNKELQQLVKGKAEVFAGTPDVNLNIIGFQAFRKLLEHQPGLLKEIAENLSAKAKIEHPGLAFEVFSIYQEHITAGDLADYLKKLSELLSGSQNPAYREVVAMSAINIALREPSLIIEWSYFVQNLLVPAAVTVRTAEQEKRLVQLINLLESKSDRNQLALHFEQVLKQRRTAKAASESTILMTKLLCERASSIEVDGEWLMRHVAGIMEQGEVVSTDILGAKLISMGKDEAQDGVRSEIGYLMAHPAMRSSILTTDIKVES